MWRFLKEVQKRLSIKPSKRYKSSSKLLDSIVSVNKRKKVNVNKFTSSKASSSEILIVICKSFLAMFRYVRYVVLHLTKAACVSIFVLIFQMSSVLHVLCPDKMNRSGNQQAFFPTRLILRKMIELDFSFFFWGIKHEKPGLEKVLIARYVWTN